MPLLTGTWKININGTEGDLNINSISADGTIFGTAINIPFSGFWNEAAQMIFFETITPITANAGVSGNPPAVSGGVARAQFTGYLFVTPPVSAPAADLRFTLSGYVRTPPSGGLGITPPTSRRFTFGWFAQITQVV
jgi:hypothetical protein